MIDTPLGYLAALLAISTAVLYAEKRRWRLFRYLPAIVVIYFSVMSAASLGVWERNEAITQTYKTLKTTLLPAMIFLLLLKADIRIVAKLGKRMLLTFFLASVSIVAGFVGMYALMHPLFPPDAWRAFAALSGSWMGGTGNMVAVQGALGIKDVDMGYALLIDSIDYAIWVMLLLAAVPYARLFNRWSGADASAIEETGRKLEALHREEGSLDFVSFFSLLSIAIVVSALSHRLAAYLPVGDFLGYGAWVVIVATVAGIVGAMTPLAKVGGSHMLGNTMLYLIVALIASRADFGELKEAPLYIAAGFVVLGIHALSMVLFAKLFKLDLFSLGVASLANIGGVASAPILASAYSKALIPVGVLMAMLGYMIGTFGGLAVGKILATV